MRRADLSDNAATFIYNGASSSATGELDFAVGNGSGGYVWPLYMDKNSVIMSGNVGIGTTNPQYKLAVNGNIGAQDIIVTNTGWSDYVFRPGYRLRPLSEVSQFIQANHHLPDIPTEAEVKEKGVSLGDMQAKLLAKVEELTLHMIQTDERNNRLEHQNQDLRDHMAQQEKQNQELRERLARLEKGAAADSIPAVAK
jgi:DNA-binding transcriptional MerR regulator